MTTTRAESELVREEKSNPGDERRQSLVRAAFEAIAADGFEGLRTRSVADRARVNIATLHYYFPTKEALIGGVAQYLAGQFIALHGPLPKPSGSAALDRLHQEFSDLRFYRERHIDLAAVMLELQLRARRDEAIAKVIDPLMGHWRGGLEEMVGEGIEEGVFRADLDPAAAGTLLMTAFSGAATQAISSPALEGVFVEIERWLVDPRRDPETQRHN
jgi:TetR/AcrR family transcriptional regulator, regulator of cefoperazone and chloramphenicol sensitivity